jgi:hypothetical protein
MKDIVLAAYVDELEKIAGIGSFLMKGLSQLKGLGGGLVRGKGRQMGRALRHQYQQKGMLGMAKKYAPAASVVGGGIGALGLGTKLLRGSRRE